MALNADTTMIPGVVIPEVFKQPDWVARTFESFKTSVKTDYSSSGSINTGLVKKLIKELILDNKVRVSYPLDKKNIGKMLTNMHKVFSDEEFQWRYMLVYQVGFFLSTFTSSSFTPEALILPDKFKKKRNVIIQEYKESQEKATSENERERNIMKVDKAFKKLTTEVLEYFRENRETYPIIDSIDSKAKGSEDDYRKLLVAVGLSINAKGEINDVIDKSHADALSPTQFFNYTSQAIVSQYKKSSETAIPGYLIRQLNTIMVSVKLSKTIDCQTKGRLGVQILNKDILQSMQGKIYDGGEITEDSTELIGKKVKLRSPLFCKAKDGICRTCYSPAFVEKMNLTENAGIGLLASTAQASLLTAMTLKASHTGLSLDKKEVDLSSDVFEYSE
jgi:DNA-directed RNA polymerase subunit beta'